MDSSTELSNLIARYAELIDLGDLDGVADLLADAAVGAGDSTSLLTGRDAILALYASTTRLHPDGTPGTKHVTTNLILDIDDDGRHGVRPFVLDRAPGGAGPAPPAHPGRPLPRPVRAARRQVAIRGASVPGGPGRRREPPHDHRPADLSGSVRPGGRSPAALTNRAGEPYVRTTVRGPRRGS